MPKQGLMVAVELRLWACSGCRAKVRFEDRLCWQCRLLIARQRLRDDVPVVPERRRAQWERETLEALGVLRGRWN